MTGLSDFIPYTSHFDPQLPPPYSFKDVSARILFLKADTGKLEALCDARLNAVIAASNQKYVIKPITSVVMMEVLHYGRMSSTTLETANAGYSSQNELFFAIPVAVYADASAEANGIVQSVGIFVPFVFVDNDWSIISGRELFGFPKLGGDFTLPADPTQMFPMGVKARVLDPYKLSTQSGFKTIVATGQSGDDTQPREGGRKDWPFGAIDELYDRSNRAAPFPVADPIKAQLEAAAGVAVRSFSLRQFRDAGSPTKASYRNVLCSDMSLTAFKRAAIVGNPLIRFPGTPNSSYKGFTSLSLVEQLGLELASPNGDVIPKFSLLYEADFEFGLEDTLVTQCGENVWSKAPGLSCIDIVGAGFKETGGLVKNQARVAKRLLERMVKADMDPESYAEDLGQGCRNAARYCKAMCRLTKTGLRHLMPD
jgi:hypothetical protein